jgi:KDO2-lipid IV(A) lauroyltransferase
MARRKVEERAAYLRHLARVLGRPIGHGEADDWFRRVTAAYTRYWVEMLALPSIDGATIDERMQVVTGWDELRTALGSGRGAILALPHLGSWEWGGAWLARRGYPMTAVAEQLEPPGLFDFFVRQRSGMGLRILSMASNTGPELLRTLRAGGLVGLVADRDLTGGGVPVELFGHATTMPAGPAMLALRTGAALFPTAVYQGPGRSHTGVMLPEVDLTRTGGLRHDVQRVTQAVASAFEDLIARAPEQWYAFQPLWSDETGASSSGRRDAAPAGTTGASFLQEAHGAS